MNYRICKHSLFLILFAALRLSAAHEPPNIAIILADDLGYQYVAALAFGQKR